MFQVFPDLSVLVKTTNRTREKGFSKGELSASAGDKNFLVFGHLISFKSNSRKELSFEVV